MAILALATGELAGMGGCNFSFPMGNFPGVGKHPAPDQFSLMASPDMAAWGVMALLMVVVLVFLLGVLAFVHLYIGSVFRFILFDAVTGANFKLLEGWRRWNRAGTRYFIFQIIFALLVMAGLALIAAPFIAWAAAIGMFTRESGAGGSAPSHHVVHIFLIVLVFVPVFFLYLLTIGLIALFAKDFCVPVMALEDAGFRAAFRRVLGFIQQEKMAYAAYVGMKIILAIAVGVAASLTVFLVALAIIIPAGLAYSMAPGMSVPPATHLLFWGTVIGAGLVLLVALIFLLGLISAPAAIFFEAYALEFFGGRYAPLGTLLHPPPVPVSLGEIPNGGLNPQAV